MQSSHSAEKCVIWAYQNLLNATRLIQYYDHNNIFFIAYTILVHLIYRVEIRKCSMEDCIPMYYNADVGNMPVCECVYFV